MSDKKSQDVIPAICGLHVVLIGNVIDGVRLVGPFATPEGAIDWAEYNTANVDWVVAEMEQATGATLRVLYEEKDS